MRAYLSRLYCREDLQPYLQARPCYKGGVGGEEMRDIWDAPGLFDIKGPDGRSFWDVSDKTEGRLVFALNMDGFNPFGNKEAGKKVSVGAMYMVCMNLPPTIRYNIENVFLVGVIPGPHEPSLHEINHFLKPLVDELHELWTHGVFLTRTRLYPHGQRVRCALGPLICDLPAARQMSGFSHFRSTNSCSECTQTHSELNNLNFKDWKPRCPQLHRKYATAWKNANSRSERDRITLLHGVRWSELLRLSYWDPTKFTVIDSMHCFYLRLMQHHVRSIWGMDVKFEDGDGITFDPKLNEPTEAEMNDAHHIFRFESQSRLAELPARILRQLCTDTSTLHNKGVKKVLLRRLLDYVSENT